MKLIQLEQGTTAWEAWRDGKIGATNASKLLGIDPWTSREDAWQIATGQAIPESQNYAMRRGVQLEPLIRRHAEEQTGILFEPACCEHDEHPWLTASLDGLDMDQTTILEVKAPNKVTHGKALRGVVVPWYWCQIQHQFLVSGATSAYYCTHNPWSFTGAAQWSLVVVPRCDEFIRAYSRAVFEWHDAISTTLNPESSAEFLDAVSSALRLVPTL